jgi:hypothetical protein
VLAGALQRHLQHRLGPTQSLTPRQRYQDAHSDTFTNMGPTTMGLQFVKRLPQFFTSLGRSVHQQRIPQDFTSAHKQTNSFGTRSVVFNRSTSPR